MNSATFARGAARAVVLLFTLTFLGAAAHAQTRYVSTNTGIATDAGPNTCTSSATPCATIQHAINQANPGNTIQLIHAPVTFGVFTESGITINKSITIQGAGPGTDSGAGATTIRAHATPGNATNRVFNITAAATSVTIRDVFIRNGKAAEGGGIQNASQGLVLQDVRFWNNETTGLGGAIYNTGSMALTNADFGNRLNSGNSTGNSAAFGGAVANAAGSSADFTNVNFTHNSATLVGGAMFSDSGSIIKMNGGIIQANTAGSNGGGLFNSQIHNSSTFTNITFRGFSIDISGPFVANSAVNGGAVYNAGSSPTFTNVTFGGENTASPTGGNTASNDGGAMFNDNGSNPSLNNVSFLGALTFPFRGSQAGRHGGAIYNDNSSPSLSDVVIRQASAVSNGGAMYNTNGSAPVITNSTIGSDNPSLVNKANNGAGIYNNNSSPTLSIVTIRGNVATTNGGGMYNNNSSPGFLGAHFIDNEAGTNGGGMWNSAGSAPLVAGVTFTGNAAGSLGGGIYKTGAGNIQISNSAFTGNSAENTGGGIFAANTSPTLSSVIFTGNTATTGAGMRLTHTNTASFTSVTFTGNAADEFGGGLSLDGAGNTPTLNNVTFEENTAQFGGGLSVTNGHPQLTGVEFRNNQAIRPTMVTRGGGIYMLNAAITLENVTFEENTTGIFSDGVRVGGGGLYSETSTVAISGSTFHANEAGTGTPVGGGILARNSTLTINDTDFTNNGRGAIDLREGSTANLTEVSFIGNTNASGGGGGMRSHASDVTIIDGLFENNNSPTSGGGLLSNGGNVTLNNVTFLDNTVASGDGGGFYRIGPDATTLNQVFFTGNATPTNGGGMYLNSSGGTHSLTTVIFNENTSENQGSGAFIHTIGTTVVNINQAAFNGNVAEGRGGGLSITGTGTVNVVNSSFIGNESEDSGGAVAISGNGTRTFRSTGFTGNEAAANGGGIYVDVVTAFGQNSVTNAVFSGNSAGGHGGGLFGGVQQIVNAVFTGNTAGSGGGLNNAGGGGGDSFAELTNVTFYNNTAISDGGGIRTSINGVTLRNAILWGNTADTGGNQIHNVSGGFTISHSLVQGGISSPGWDAGNNLTGNPLFVNAGGGNLRLHETSPAINAGDPTTDLSLFPSGPGSPRDLDGQPRVFNPGSGGVIDMGAYEFQGEGSPGVDIVQNYPAVWTLAGLPTDAPHTSFTQIFTQAQPGSLYRFEGGSLHAEETLDAGTGYWLRFIEPETVTFAGSPLGPLSIGLDAGWNIISGPGEVVPVGQISDPGGIISGPIYGFTDAYFDATEIEPGLGYWVRTTGSGTIDVPGTGPGKVQDVLASIKPDAFTRLTVSSGERSAPVLYFGASLPEGHSMEHWLMPPLPPQGSFDARLAGGYRLSEAEEVTVEIQQTGAPVSIHLDINRPGIDYELVEWNATGELARRHIVPGDEVILSEATIRISLAMVHGNTANDLPQSISLIQNYPNPFNPATIIGYQLPQSSDVLLEVFDMIGRRVALLLDGRQPAGHHEISFDASNLTSGVYIYRLHVQHSGSDGSASFVQTKKMTLLR